MSRNSKQTTPTIDTFPELVQKIDELTKLLAEQSKVIARQDSRFDRLEKLWGDAKKENKELQEALQEKEREIVNIRERMNDQEQYTRSWCIRVLNLPIPQADATDPLKVMQHLYDKILLPIFQGAVEQGLLQQIPPVNQILETAHILPSKPNTINPIIARFYSRNIRALIFRLKKDFAPRHDPPQPAPNTRRTPSQQQHQEQRGKYKYLIFEDLTRITFNKMRAISQREEVESCWSVSGQLKFKLKNDQTVRKVKSIFANIDDILKTKA
jgi:hypothetical protein